VHISPWYNIACLYVGYSTYYTG